MYALIEGFKSFRDAGWAFLGIFYSSYCLYFPISREDNIFFYRVYNNATWFFTAFFCASVLFLIYKELCLKKRQKIAVFILFILLTQTLSICPIFLPWNLDKAFIGANFMIIGYELKQYKVFEIQDFYIKICSTIFMIVIYVGLVNYNPEINLATREYGNRNFYSVVLYLLIGVIGTILCVWLSKLICPIPILGNVLAKLGSTTVPIISFHILLFHLLDGFVNRYVTESVLNSHYWEYGALKIGVTCLLILLAKCGVQFTKEEYKAKERQRIKYE